MTKIARAHSAGCNGKGNSMNTRMKALLTTAALMLMAWHPAAHAEMSLYYIHNDHLGTPQVVTNEDQNVVWQADYQPFGEVDVTVNTLDQEARFPGQYTDDVTGLHYNYFRDYDPSIGRYIQSDPIGLNGGINTYGYAYQNPVMYTDPNGLNPGAGCLAGAWGGPIGCGVGATIGTVIVGGVALAAILSTPGDTPHSRSEADLSFERQTEYLRYTGVCNTPPPPTGNRCKDMREEIKWMKTCRDMRQQWDDRWFPGKHATDIRNLNRGIRKLEKRYANAWECKDAPLDCD